MTETEDYLSEYSSAVRLKRKYENDLIAARRLYDEFAEQYPPPSVGARPGLSKKNRKITKPTENAAIYLVDSFGTRIESIKTKILSVDCEIAARQSLVDAAGLTPVEREYVHYRYFDGYGAEKTARLMYLSYATTYNIRNRALEKIDAIKKGAAHKQPQEEECN